MTEKAIQHTQLYGIVDYTAALDTLCRLAKRNLYLFDKNFEGQGFNSVSRYDALHDFLLASPMNRLYVLTHDTHYLATQCPRMLMLLRQFDSIMTIRQTPQHLRHIAEPFAIADDEHYVRRFHFDDLRGVLAQDDPQNARVLKSRFMDMWESSHSCIPTTTLGL